MAYAPLLFLFSLLQYNWNIQLSHVIHKFKFFNLVVNLYSILRKEQSLKRLIEYKKGDMEHFILRV